MATKRAILFVTVLTCSGYSPLATANPLIGLKQSVDNDLTERSGQPRQKVERIRSFNAETGKFTEYQAVIQPEVPSFRVENGKVVYKRTILPEDNYREYEQQAPFHTLEHDQDDEDGVVSHGDVWSIGDGWLGGKFEYNVWGRDDGTSYALARFSATVLGNANDFIRTSVRTDRDRNNTYYKVDDDSFSYKAEAFAFGDTIALEEGKVTLGNWRQTAGKRFQKTFYQNTWRYAVGPVPIRLWARLAGVVETGNPKITAGAVGYRDVSFTAQSDPSASLVAQGGADVFGDIPANIRPGDVGMRVQVDFLKGRVNARSHGNTANRAACLNVDFRNFTTLAGSLTAFAYWNALQVLQVETFVSGVCNNGLFNIPGCSEVQSFISTVNNWTSFNYEKEIFRRSGFHFGNARPWLNYQGCLTNKPDTVLRLCTQFDDPIYAIIGYKDFQKDAFLSKGWYEIPANGCRDISIGGYQGKSAYVYAEHNQGATAWSGENGSLCVHKTERFELVPGDNFASCNGDYKSVNVSKMDITPNGTATYTFRSE